MKPREPRHKVIIQARMRCDGAWVDVCIRNISSRGLLLQAAAPPGRGSYIEIFKARHIIVGRVVWAKDRRFGIRTQERLDVAAIIEESTGGGAQAGAVTVDRRAATRMPSKTTAATAAERLERSRRLSGLFQFGCIIICGAAAAMIIAGAVRDALSRPLRAVSTQFEQVS